MLSKSSKEILERNGLNLLCGESRCYISKKIGIEGNSLPNWNSIPLITNDKNGNEIKLISDCPHMWLWFKKENFQLICWDWVPGPGPGDFNLDFNDENELIEFILSYYFGSNKYFAQRLEHELSKNNS